MTHPVKRKAAVHTAKIREEVIMPVSYSCPASADITMFGDVVVWLPELRGIERVRPPAFSLSKMSKRRWSVWRLRSRQTCNEQSRRLCMGG
jgi:hypothetical protein